MTRHRSQSRKSHRDRKSYHKHRGIFDEPVYTGYNPNYGGYVGYTTPVVVAPTPVVVAPPAAYNYAYEYSYSGAAPIIAPVPIKGMVAAQDVQTYVVHTGIAPVTRAVQNPVTTTVAWETYETYETCTYHKPAQYTYYPRG